MKRTYSINVAGFPFTIDDDAYTLLNDYLHTIEKAFAHAEDSTELISDIESRVAELLMECTSTGSPIVTVTDVENVITRVGRPEEMIEENVSISADGSEESVSAQETVTPPPFIPKAPVPSKKLYRDPQNAMLGGVCAGLAYYFNCDVTWVRIITILLTLGSAAVGSIAYIILWIVLPEAITPLERMHMMGEAPTMENIGKTVTDTFREDQGLKVSDEQIRRASFPTALNNGLDILMKVLIALGLIIGIPVLIALILGGIGCIFTLLMWGAVCWTGFTSPFPADSEPYVVMGVICGMGGCLVLGIPLYLLLRRGISTRKHLSRPAKAALIILWVIGFIAAAVTAGIISGLVQEEEKRFQERWNQQVFEETEQLEDLTPYVTDSVPGAFDESAIITDSVTVATAGNSI